MINITKRGCSKKSTMVVTVVTRLNGDLVNLFPGLP
jgi:hypothetical protein